MNWRRIAFVAAATLLAAATVAVFLYFDSRSHSNSDTLRPFIITMVPVWVAFVLGWRFLARPHGADHRR